MFGPIRSTDTCHNFSEAIAHHSRALREHSNILTIQVLIVIVFERNSDQIGKMCSWKVSISRRKIPFVKLMKMAACISVLNAFCNEFT